MGRKKPTTRDNDNPTAGGTTKSKKKNQIIDDDEYGISADISEDQTKQNNELEEPVAPVAGKKKNKRGAKHKDEEDDDKSVELEEDVVPVVFTGKKKSQSKKGGSSVFGGSAFGLLEGEGEDKVDEDKENEDEDEEEDPPVVKFTGKKKSSKSSKKGGTGFNALGEEDEAEDEDKNEEDDDMPVSAFSGKKKSSRKGSSSFAATSFDALGKEDEANDENKEEEDDMPVNVFSGKKKSSKSSKKGSSLFASISIDALGEEDKVKDDDEEDDTPVITFSGKKKSSKSTKKSNSFSAAALLGEEGNDDVSVSESKTSDAIDGEEDSEAIQIVFTGKKKSSKSKKNNGLSTASSLDEDTDMTKQPSLRNEADGNSAIDAKASGQGNNAVAETSKNKKKKKKSGRTVQEEDDLDKILAELGEGPAKSAGPPPQEEEKVQIQPEPVGQVEAAGEEKEAEADTGESAAAKKKKKKKEKEKEKKAAAVAVSSVAEVKEEKKVELKSKLPDKKLPKHVREMQEALARRKEAEERQKKEEEEKLRREEEERQRQEELEQQAEEARRRKKEREKEKLIKKKEAGLYLTGKQKEEARRREAMRNQFLARGVVLPTADTASVGAKKPKYEKKKSKLTSVQANGESNAKADQQESVTEEVSSEVGKVQEVEPVVADTAEKMEVEPAVEENGNKEEEEEDDDDWDAKSWDEADLKLNVKSPFAEEEVESKPEPVPAPVVKKETKRVTASSPGDVKLTVAKKAVDPPTKTQDVELENKDDGNDVEVSDKSNRTGAAKKREARAMEAHSKRSADNLRSPICCIMGHVDTGKTKLLDCIRGTNVQEGEAGGITQQIGATYFPAENIRERTRELKADAKLKVPGLLVIDTPGHESFTNLRSRGSGLCDIAILVVDIMHGLEPQTIESLNLLKMRNTEFIVALNKVDRLYNWKTCPNAPIVKAMKQQSSDVQNEFKQRLTHIVTQFKEQGLNTELYYKNKEMGETFSIVPTSAISGEGIPDLLLLLVQWTQKTMVEKLMFTNEIQCTVLEVKVIEGLGTTIDVVLVNGMLHEGDQIVVCGMQGPIVTTIRALLTPHPMKELRVKGSYLHHKELKAAQGIKITAQGLEHAIAGTGLYVVGPEDDLEDIKETTMQDMKSVMSRIDKSGEGVCVQASTLGSLEALLEFLKSPAVSIPVSGVSIGPVHKKDVMKASVMLERKREYAAILAFDVKVTPEARELADETGVKIFIADIIYHLFDQFKAYIDNLKEEKKKEAAEEAVFPCVLKIMPNCIFNKKDPIVLGVDVAEGIAKVGTPICIPTRECIDIGRIASIEINHKQVDTAKKGQKVAIKIASTNPEEQQKMYGRHFEIDDELVSHISRKSIDVLKTNYRDDLSIEEWKLLVTLKKRFGIQ